MHWFCLLLAVSVLTLPQGKADTNPSNSCVIARQGNTLEFKIGEQLVGKYLIDPSQTKPHFHPLYSMGGQPVTRFFPMVKDVPGESKDHVHHRGCWIGHQIVELETSKPGEQPLNANFWAEGVNPVKQAQGKQICVKVEEPQSEAGRAWVVTHNDWQTTAGKPILKEKRTLHLVDLGSARLIVIDVDFQATQGGITFGDEKDGFMAVRVADTMAETRKQGGTLENAEGKKHMGGNNNVDRQGCWGLRSGWVDYCGPVQGKTVGVTLMDHPKNPVPACWHARDYGLFSANPFGRKGAKFPDAMNIPTLVKIPAGGRLQFRYGVLIHDGNATEGQVAGHFKRFAELPWIQ